MPQDRPRRLKRVLWTAIALELLASPVLWTMADGPPKIIVGGIWIVILILTGAAIFVIGITTQIDKR